MQVGEATSPRASFPLQNCDQTLPAGWVTEGACCLVVEEHTVMEGLHSCAQLLCSELSEVADVSFPDLAVESNVFLLVPFMCCPLLQAESAVLARMSDSKLFIQLLMTFPSFCLEQAADQRRLFAFSERQ